MKALRLMSPHHLLSLTTSNKASANL